MSEADCRQQQELEEQRMRLELDALLQIDQRGMHDVAEFLATGLGLTNEFNRERTQWQKYMK